MKKSIIVLVSFLLSISGYASGGLEQIDLSGNLHFDLGSSLSRNKQCFALEKSASKQDLEIDLRDHQENLSYQALTTISKVFVCPVTGDAGGLNEFIFIAKNAANKNILVVATPFFDYTFEVVASEPGKLYLSLNGADKSGTLLINPNPQGQ